MLLPLNLGDLFEWEIPRQNTRFHKATDNDVRSAMTQLSKGTIAVQAGGYMGVWPACLSELYDEVYTFEADRENYECLVKNTAHKPNIISRHAALGNQYGFVHTWLSDGEAHNYGAKKIMAGGDVPVVCIDDLELPSCDLIYLDIEGSEVAALKGAVNTIEKYSPIIGVEIKHAKGVLPLLANMGYQSFFKPSSLDVMLRKSHAVSG